MNWTALANWCQDHAGRLAGLLVGMVFLAWGGLNCAPGLMVAERFVVSVASVEAGQHLPGRWLEMTGRLLTEDRIIWPIVLDAGPKETYVPLVSESWQPGQPVAVFVRAREEPYGQPGLLLRHAEPSVSGMVDRSGLPLELADLFADFQMPPRDDVFILDYEAAPSPQSEFLGYIGLGLGGAILLVTAIVWVIKR